METHNFTNITNNDGKVPKVIKPKQATPNKTSAFKNKKKKSLKDYINPNWTNVYIKHGVAVVLVKDNEEDYTLINDIHDVMKLQKKKPSNIVGFVPEIYHEFVNPKTDELINYVNQGDLVIFKPKFAPNYNMPKIVKEVYIKSINDMAVFIAVLDDKSIALCNQLITVT